jgi:hypothetical protein
VNHEPQWCKEVMRKPDWKNPVPSPRMSSWWSWKGKWRNCQSLLNGYLRHLLLLSRRRERRGEGERTVESRVNASVAILCIASAAQSVTIASPPNEAPYLFKQVVPVTFSESQHEKRKKSGKQDEQKPGAFIFCKVPRETMIPAPP